MRTLLQPAMTGVESVRLGCAPRGGLLGGDVEMKALIAFACSIVGAFTLGAVIFYSLMATGNYCSAGGAAGGILFGFPIGGVIGILIYRAFSHQLRKSDILGVLLGLVLSSAGALTGLRFMDFFRGFRGYFALSFALVLSCLCALLGYKIALGIAVRLRRTDRT